MGKKLRLIFKNNIADENGVLADTEYITDIIELPCNAKCLNTYNAKNHGWLPNVIGGEWIEEA